MDSFALDCSSPAAKSCAPIRLKATRSHWPRASVLSRRQSSTSDPSPEPGFIASETIDGEGVVPYFFVRTPSSVNAPMPRRLAWHATDALTPLFNDTTASLGDDVSVCMMASRLAAAGVAAAEQSTQPGLRQQSLCDCFALTTHPGHHASVEHYGGYCFINNAVVVVRALQQMGRAPFLVNRLATKGGGAQGMSMRALGWPTYATAVKHVAVKHVAEKHVAEWRLRPRPTPRPTPHPTSRPTPHPTPRPTPRPTHVRTQIDLDYHAGDGSASILLDPDTDPDTGGKQCGFVSLHAAEDYPFLPTDTAWAIPVPPGATWDVYAPLLQAALERRSAACDVLVVSLGFDTLAADPDAREGHQLALVPADFARMRQLLRETGLPLVAVQEGGYSLAQIPDAAEAFWTDTPPAAMLVVE